jgi:hypothetical protein
MSTRRAVVRACPSAPGCLSAQPWRRDRQSGVAQGDRGESEHADRREDVEDAQGLGVAPDRAGGEEHGGSEPERGFARHPAASAPGEGERG